MVSKKQTKSKPASVPRDYSISHNIGALAVLGLSIFWLFVGFQSRDVGVVGSWLNRFGHWVVGEANVVLPLFLMAAVVVLIASRYQAKRFQAIVGLCVAAMMVSAMFTVAMDDGGWLGYGLATGLVTSVGLVGFWIGILAGFLIAGMLLFQFQVSDVFHVCRVLLRELFGVGVRAAKNRRSVPEPVVKPAKVSCNVVPDPKTPQPKAVVPVPILEPTIYKPVVPEKKKPVLIQAPVASDYSYPELALLAPAPEQSADTSEIIAARKEQAKQLEVALKSFHVDAVVVNITPGPSVTRFELKPGVGVKISKITGLANDIALKLAAPDVRIEAPIPGKSLIGIEVPNETVEPVNIRRLVETSSFMETESKLTACMGLTITGESILMDLAKMPHVLIAGATGSGKSVCVNAIILSILLRATPDEVKFVMIDPKKVELNLYEGIPHLAAPVVTDPHKAAATLKKWALKEMEDRYEIFSKLGVKHITGFNDKISEIRETYKENPAAAKKVLEEQLGYDVSVEDFQLPEKLPYIVVIIDELADLMMVASQDVENTICRLAQMSRATGIHLVIATQRPSVNVVTGLIKANVPSRVSFFLQSQIDSRTILDSGGAEKLLGKGDMLYMPVGAFKPQRVQGVFVSEKEVKDVVKFWKAQGGPNYVTEIMDVEADGDSASGGDQPDGVDALFEQAKKIVQSTQQASTSYLQRKLRIGYNRAARIIDELEENGVISSYDAETKSRHIL